MNLLAMLGRATADAGAAAAYAGVVTSINVYYALACLSRYC